MSNRHKAMSDTFAEEFEKWLENNPDARNAEETDEDINDNESEYVGNSAHNDEFESDIDKWDKNEPDRHSELISGSLNDQAPILVDDDDDDNDLFPSDKHYEEEPPVLEPVPRQLPNYISSMRISHQNRTTCIRSYSKSQQKYGKEQLTKEQKHVMKYKNKVSRPSSETDDEEPHLRNALTSSDSKNDNIFDKFISEKYSFPPSLSSEVVQIRLEPSSAMAKNPSHSPDFCAMEADSTSEINGDKVNSVYSYRRQSKSSVHGDISVECDSTCMLAASPLIISPASVSNGETEEVRDTGKDENKDGELENMDITSKKCDNIVESDTTCERNSIIMQTTGHMSNGETMTFTAKIGGFDTDSELATAKGFASHKDSNVSDVNCLSGSDVKSSVTIKIDAPDCSGEPPDLSAISPSCRPRYSLREKRHTIDSPENFSASRKRPHVTSLAPTESDSFVKESLIPPALTPASGAIIASNSRDKRPKVTPQNSAKHECKNCHRQKNHHKNQKRRNTVPSSNVAEYHTALSEDAQRFVVCMSQLSRIQTHMHKLLQQLFPQLSAELDAMSPESFNFMNLLSNIVELLEQPDDQDNSTPPSLTLYDDVKPSSVHDLPCTSKFTSSCGLSDESSALSSSTCSQAPGDTTVSSLKLDAASCEFSSPPVLSSIDVYDCQQRQHTTAQQLTSEDSDNDLLAPLSLLTVKDAEDILTPSKVLLCREPDLLLDKCIRLSCRALQLLLPDLTVSLYNELAQSPNDLIAFVHNVILANSRRRSKH